MPVLVKAGVQPPLINIVCAAGNVAERLGITLRITAGIDGVHMVGSLHYALRAGDIGCREFTPDVKRKIVRELQLELGPDYDVLLEHEGDAKKEHIHAEFDPKKRA